MALEIYTVTRPYPPPLLTNIINPILTAYSGRPPLLQFQFLELARNCLFTTFVGMSQLGPLLQTRQATKSPNEVPPNQLAALEQLARAGEEETSRLLRLEMSPHAAGQGSLSDLQSRVKNWLVQSTIRSDPQVKHSIEEVLNRRRGGHVE